MGGRRNPRITRRIIVFLVLIVGGAIVNVAVAWGMSLRSWPYAQQFGFTQAHAPTQQVIQWWRRYAPEDFPEPAVVYTLHRLGYRSLAAHDKADMQDSLYFGYSRAQGWPLVCLETQHWVKRATTDQYRALPLNSWPWSLRSPHEFPIVPLWPGFAINTVFYAAILWALCAAPRALRRRRRIKRGQCPACAYPVGASDVCTECGRSFPPPLRAGVRGRVKHTNSEKAVRAAHPLAPSLKGGANKA